MHAAQRSAKLSRFRTIAFWEGVSTVALFGIAMPLKYLANQPLAVTYVGWVHGVLFILYALLLLDAMRSFGWPLKRGALYFAASLVPLAPFVVERQLKREQEAMA